MENSFFESYLDQFIEAALKEDVGSGDITSEACIPADARCEAKLLVKDPGVLAGVQLAQRTFEMLDAQSQFETYFPDGSDVSVGDIAFRVECNARKLLMGERLVLNAMQRMSGIATLSNQFKFEVEDLPVTILDTRKTTPLIRFLEKWAVKLGGCDNYRFGLYDWFMIKDNHIDACGGIRQAIERIHAYQQEKGIQHGITVEVRNLMELYEVLKVGQINRIMLDNFEIPLMREAVDIINKQYETEASGGVNIHTVRQIAKTGVDFISVGALTHSATSLDLSLKIQK
ncbi:MAG TPA: carboxylating nicotinate-nucleotide diphosphorylase [Saprospiraceae bacterium]|nr:carboxylating nicotinate-nucleotide diphosphorylase [Saprospiraceae bacterium]HMQ81576.1 carboxylating nicotinate-nucleotide diphosphorylase [Saprospiraceae bacterium]